MKSFYPTFFSVCLLFLSFVLIVCGKLQAGEEIDNNAAVVKLQFLRQTSTLLDPNSHDAKAHDSMCWPNAEPKVEPKPKAEHDPKWKPKPSPHLPGPSTTGGANETQLQQIRNAAVKITYGTTTFLVDPMLSRKGTYPGFKGTYRSELRNPLVELPMSTQAVLAGVDAVIVTHTHLDHWDDAAQEVLPKDVPLFVQDERDEQTIRSQGFQNVRILEDGTQFGGVTLSKTGGQHGTDEMFACESLAEFLGVAMGVVFEAPGHKTTYLVGDTIWCNQVDQALARYNPDVIVINAGYARVTGYEGAIIMGKEDVVRAARTMPEATIVATHMDSINHMGQSRKDLRAYVAGTNVEDRVEIPADGAVVHF